MTKTVGRGGAKQVIDGIDLGMDNNGQYALRTCVKLPKNKFHLKGGKMLK